jgi:transcription-repair coupling factor (superfamily II helicase)
MYKKLAAVRDREGVSLLQEEFEDRFGDPPTPLWNALSLIRLRLRCQEIGIESIGAELPRVNIQFKRSVKLPAHAIKPLTFAFKQQRHNFTPERVTLNLTNPARLLQTIEEMLEILDKAMKEPAPPAPERGSSVTGRHGRNAPPRPPLSGRR